MKIEKRSENSYRVRKTYKGKTYTLNFDHKPSQKEIALEMAKKMEGSGMPIKGTFEEKALEYISLKEPVSSPSTIEGYEKILRQISKEFKETKFDDIDDILIQKELNRYSVGRSPKTVKNMAGFISPVFGLFKPSYKINVSLPQAEKFEGYLPTTDEVKRIIKSVEGTDYHIPFQLGALGLRRSEICALSIDDICDDKLQINKAMVYRKKEWIIKPYAKTTEGKREIALNEGLIKEIIEQGYIFDKTPSNILRVLHQKQDELKIPRFRLHDMRHFYCSYAHAQGESEAFILESGGWQSPYVMKRIYRHAMKDEKEKAQKKIASSLFD